MAMVLSIIIILFGVIGFKFLGVRDYPAIDPPNISVRTLKLLVSSAILFSVAIILAA